MNKWKAISATILLFGLFSIPNARAYFTPPEEKSAEEMNGIKLNQFKDFQKKWKLVTVRFRQDTGEMRFTYANPIAYRVLNSMKPDYPKGAVFAKIGVRTAEDPAFASSKIPSGAKRVQFMVRDPKKYASTEGWGYALFNESGRVFTDEPIGAKTMACAACHRLVPERGYVFSRMMFIDPFAPATKAVAQAEVQRDQVLSGVPFDDIKAQELIAELATVAQHEAAVHKPALEALKNNDVIYSVKGDLKKYAFSGTLDEIVPTLLQRSMSSRTLATLFLNKHNYSMVFPEKAGSEEVCPHSKSKSKMRILVVFNGRLVQDTKICP